MGFENIIIILNLVMAILSTNFFLNMLKFSIYEWVCSNICAPTIYILSIGYFLNNPFFINMSLILLFRYGTLGLYIFTWSLKNLMPQLSHILMTLALLVLVKKILVGKLKLSIMGLISGLILMFVVSSMQNEFFLQNPQKLEDLFNGNYKF
jgi:hypothetical protein